MCFSYDITNADIPDTGYHRYGKDVVNSTPLLPGIREFAQRNGKWHDPKIMPFLKTGIMKYEGRSHGNAEFVSCSLQMLSEHTRGRKIGNTLSFRMLIRECRPYRIPA